MLDLTLVVVGKDLDALREWKDNNLDGCKVILFANVNRKSMAELGNKFLDECQTCVMGLVHADTSFGSGALASFTRVAMDGKICGIVGRDPGKGNRWSKYLIGYDDHASPVSSLGPGKVCTLDCSSMFIRPDLGVRFDQVVFDGMHCYVEDLCLQARIMGIEIVVPSAEASHRGDSTFDRQWQRDYGKYKSRLDWKWAGTEFETT